MRFLILFLLVSTSLQAQITGAAQKAINTHVDYANQSSKEITAVVKSIIDFYPLIRQSKSFGQARYTCPIQMGDYFFNQSIEQEKNLQPEIAARLRKKLLLIKESAEKIDEACKSLDTYHKLEDYKQDNYAKADTIVKAMPALLNEYRNAQNLFQQDLDKINNTSTNTSDYQKAASLMQKIIANERTLLEAMHFNLLENLHTGWPVSALEKSIPATDQSLQNLKLQRITLQYPASSMWTSFQSSLATYTEAKRNALDGYNSEAKKSDRYSNDVYLNLINYFNGTLIADYNTFIQFSERDNFRGIKLIEFTPLLALNADVHESKITVGLFEDIAYKAIPVVPRKTPISKTEYESLTHYIDYINETWRQVRYMQMVLRSFNSSAAYYKILTSYEKRGGLHFDYSDYQPPLSRLQKALTESKVLPANVAASLNDQAQVLMNILKEIEQHSGAIEIEVKEKRYEIDHLARIYEHLERQRELFQLWDERKERLYADIRKVFEAYAKTNAPSSWQVSGDALRTLVDLDHEALFQAKAFYQGDSTKRIDTEKINETLRQVIAKEYDNMKGIEKYGRNNGLCPYTPYEDIPQTSKTLVEQLLKRKPVKSTQRHPYEELIYSYNDIVDDYNKFCELSKNVFLLKTVLQPELFFVQYPQKSQETTPNRSTTLPEPAKSHVNNSQVSEAKTALQIIRDTIYIEKRDTIYMTAADSNLRSMEGYAVNNMVLLLDVSGSMNAPDKLPLLKQSVLNMLTMMREQDEVSIVVFSGKARVLLQPTSFQEETKIKKAIDALTSSGKTDGNAGIKLAIQLADKNYIRGGNNRIILATDGEFPLSKETEQMIQRFASQDIFLSVFNFGKSTSSANTLERIAQSGKGNYEFISKENAELKLIREAKSKKAK